MSMLQQSLRPHSILGRRRPRSTNARSLWAVHSETGVVSHNEAPLFQTIIGLEIHAQLDIATKLFSSAKVSRSLTQAPNSLVQPFDLAVPGMLPVCSKSAVQAAVLTAAALNCEIASVSRFERKHYHYADLPFGYQVTQQRWPIARNGSIQLSAYASAPNKKKRKQMTEPFKVGIDRIQLEQDTGKTTISTSLSKEGKPLERSNVDFNRAGCSLIEIVMNPDLRSSKHAAETVETLRQLLKHIGTCNGRMEEGSLRVDLNVSLQPLEDIASFTPNLNNRVEVKNLNSLRQVQQAAEYEAVRQAKLVSEDSSASFRETRTFHVKSGKTVVIRTKEGEEDYRFMPEPDIPPVVLNDDVLDGKSLDGFLKDTLAELPEAARERLRQDYQLDEYTAAVIAADPPAVRLYDEAVETARDNLPEKEHKSVPNAVAKVLCNDLFAKIREDEERCRELEGEEAAGDAEEYSRVNGYQLGELVGLQEKGIISTTQAKKLLTILYEDEIGRSPKEVAQERGLQLISDAEELRRLSNATLDKFPDQLEQYKKGGKHVTKMTKFILGKVMAESRGNAHPERMHEALEEVLEERAPGIN